MDSFSPSHPQKCSVALLIPVLNEEESLPFVLPLINPDWVDEILFVDGGSTDRTVELIRQWGKGDVFVQTQPGLAKAYFESISRIKSDYVIAFSPDGNSLPELIPELIAKADEGYDMVIASRYLPGAGSDDDDVFTSLGNWMFTKIINILFGSSYTDCLIMLRIYRKSIIQTLNLRPRTHCFEPMLAIRCAVHKCRTTDIPGREPKRIGGERKMQVIENGWAITKCIIYEWFRFLKLKMQDEL